jgi:hypothetical protein
MDAQDLVASFRALPGSVEVQLGLQVTWGLLDVETETYTADPSARAQVLGETLTLTLPQGVLQGLAKGTHLLVGGEDLIAGPIHKKPAGTLQLTLERP